MTDKKAATLAKDELPTEIIVTTDWAEAQMANGVLSLTPNQIRKLEGNASISLPADLVTQVLGPSKRKTPVEWIDPREAVHWLSQRIGGDAAAKSAIAERFRDGAIECSIVWMSQGPDIGPVSNRRPRFPVLSSKPSGTSWVTPINRGSKPLKLGGALLRFSDDWDADQKRWDWQRGIFIFSNNLTSIVRVNEIPIEERKSQLRYRLVVSGIRFSSKDVKRIVEGENPNSVEADGSTGKRGRSGPRRKKFNYGPILSRLESEISNGKISRLGNVSDFGMQAKLEREITRELTDDDGLEPSETTVRRTTTRLMEMWKQHLLIKPR